jgi:tetratricopeptide (TPR) repeat protein
MLSRLSSLSLVAILALTTDGTAQIPERSRNPNAPRPGAPMVLVATPYTIHADDSAAAVEVGVGLRDRTRRNLGRDYAVVQRDRMNEALISFGYPADALLDQNAARTLASRSSSRLLVFPLYLRSNPGHRIQVRFIAVGASYGAGHVVSLNQMSGEDPEELGERAANELRPAFAAMTDALDCYGNAATDRAKAVEAAQKAIRAIPNFGAAEFCLGELARATDSVSTTALAHYENAGKSDPMSLATYEKMGSIYHLRGDSAKVITTYQTMLQVDPLDQALRERSFQLFSIYGRPGAAEDVADAGIARDPDNTDWYDLKSNACLMQEKYSCAIDELERLWTNDSTRADSSFFSKITYATLGGNDTTRFVKWALKGVEKYPEHLDILNAANRAYGMTGDADMAIASARKLLEINPYDPAPVNRTVVLLGNAGQAERIIEFLPVVKDAQDDELSNNFASILVNAASTIGSGTTPNLPKAALLSQAAIDAAPTNATVLAYANYFVSANLMSQVGPMSQAVRQTSRSCTQVREYKDLLDRVKPALEAASSAPNEAIRKYVMETALPGVRTELTFVGQLLPSVCG